MRAKGAALIGLVVGFVCGSVATFFYMRNKEETIEYEPEKDNLKEEEIYTNIISSNSYSQPPVTEAKSSISSYSEKYNTTVEVKKDELENMDKPISISYDAIPDEYSVFTLKYFKDGVLLDDQNNPVEDVEHTVGLDFAEHFGEFDGDEDVVYIRNNRTKSVYEIMYVDYDFMDS